MIERQLDAQFHESLKRFEKAGCLKGDLMNREKFEFITIDKDEIADIVAKHFSNAQAGICVNKEDVHLQAYENGGEWGRSYEIQCEIKRKLD